MIIRSKNCGDSTLLFDVEFPTDALPLEKLMIISNIFMLVYLKEDKDRKDDLILTRKRKEFPGLPPNFS